MNIICCFECRQPALVASRSDHSVLFDGVSDVRKLMAVAYKPELATILGSCMQGMLHGLETGPEGQSNVTRGRGIPPELWHGEMPEGRPAPALAAQGPCEWSSLPQSARSSRQDV
jgi:hypothetical protein